MLGRVRARYGAKGGKGIRAACAAYSMECRLVQRSGKGVAARRQRVDKRVRRYARGARDEVRGEFMAIY